MKFGGIYVPAPLRSWAAVISSSLAITLCSLALLYQDEIEKVLLQSAEDKPLQTAFMFKLFIAACCLCIFMSSCHLLVAVCFIMGLYRCFQPLPKKKCFVCQSKPKATVETKSSAALLKSSAAPAAPAPAPAPVPTQTV
ncbi:uncharacterized protein LOC105665549 [Ceratitis capitata]|uniref:(Mediterranean fruit fly) hypothetical protein n=1 Tax=Ceratitis capitata TaxID=7213 RepID=A0A811VBD6_CERCA|nr:uncharacterized protein LOC105665549 [Ceratitis capitata]CAD7012291.1 unnamed protein product [Ceratitis capitata]